MGLNVVIALLLCIAIANAIMSLLGLHPDPRVDLTFMLILLLIAAALIGLDHIFAPVADGLPVG